MSYNIRDIETGEILKIADVGGGGGGSGSSTEENEIDLSKFNCRAAIPKQDKAGRLEKIKDYEIYEATLVKEILQVENASVKKIKDKLYYPYSSNEWYLVIGQKNSYSLKRTTPIIDNSNISSLWDDGDNIYSGSSLVLNEKTNTWETKNWNNLPNNFYIQYIYKIRKDVYYSYNGSNYKLNKETDTWEEIENWGDKYPRYGSYIFEFENNFYCFNGSNNRLIFNEETNTWEEVIWDTTAVINGSSLYADNMWTTEGDLYNTYSGVTYKLNKETSTWEAVTWNGEYKPSSGSSIWTDGINIYSCDSYQVMYKLNKENETWERYIPSTYIYRKKDLLGILKSIRGNLYFQDYNSNRKLYSYTYGDMWEEVSYADFEKGKTLDNFWTDGTNQYYSDGTVQYVYDKNAYEWKEKTWEGLTSFSGSLIWTDGTNFYYYASSDKKHYILDASTSTWSQVIMKGLDNYFRYFSFSPSMIWSDGVNIHYDDEDIEGWSCHLIFDKSTLTWSSSTGGSVTVGSGVWSDGNTIYYSGDEYGSYYETYEADKVFNKTTSSWEEMNWNAVINHASYITKDDSGAIYLLSTNNSLYTLDKENRKWTRYRRSGASTYMSYEGIWSDGKDIYYNDYILDRFKSTWTRISFYPIENLNGRNVWSDGDNIYYSNSDQQYKLNKQTKVWEPYYWYGATPTTSSFWQDEDGIHYHSRTLNEETSIWEETYSISPSNTSSDDLLNNQDTWTDGENIYYSNGNTQKKYNKETNTWEEMEWFGDILENNGMNYCFYGRNIWKDNEGNIYIGCNAWTSVTDFKLDKESFTWNKQEWKDDSGNTVKVQAGYIWKIGEDIYFFNYDKQYVLLDSGIWSLLNWGIDDFYKYNIWSIGEDIYYSDRDQQYKMNKQDKTWEPVIWNIDNFDDLQGSDIWEYKDNVYLGLKYKLNKETNTWERKIWGGITVIEGNCIWSDGENIYYSNGSENYKLNKETNTWEKMIWQELYNEQGNWNAGNWKGYNIWSDGENIYYNDSYSGNYSFKLNKETNTWEQMDWQGLDEAIEGCNIWTNGKQIFYELSTYTQEYNSYGSYVLDLKTMKWKRIVWTTEDEYYISGVRPWTDGKNYYVGTSYKIIFD